jgi:hypothetical protein
VSKSFNIAQLNPQEGFVEQLRPIRYISRVVECEQNQFIKSGNGIIIRKIPNARQELFAVFESGAGQHDCR